MLWELGLGAAVIAASVIAQVVFIGVIIYGFETFSSWLTRARNRYARLPIGLAIASLWLMAAHSVSIWLWAATFLGAGAFKELETAVYFASVCYTTLGFGDITPDPGWRILAGLCAANGFLTFGISTAFLVELLQRMWRVAHGGASQLW